MKTAGPFQALKRMEPCELERLIGRLQGLAAVAREALRRKQGGGEFGLSFEAAADPRESAPYVARLSVRDGRLERGFVELNRIAEPQAGNGWG